MRAPKVAELVAEELRRRILSGQLADGSELESQDRLLEEFAVSRASMREALRILETEGLITVRRGSVGGAIVHTPGAQISAYTLALSLERDHVPIADVGESLRHLEAQCAALCAARPDRAEVAAELQALNDRAEEEVADWPQLVELTSQFHELLVQRCGHATLAMVVGAVESLWLSHVRAWAVEAAEAGADPPIAYRLAGVKVHRRIAELIARGEQAKVAKLVAEHVDPRRFELTADAGRQQVTAALVRP